MDDWWLFFAIGFVAQLVDGALGMAYGVLTNTTLLAIGLPPAHASALVHTAEIFTTSASAASHIYHRNVDWRMVVRLGVTGVLGAILGASILSNVDVTAARRFVYAYLLIMGLLSLEIDADCTGTAKVRRLDCAARICRGISRRKWRWWLGTDDDLNARRLGACAALLRGLGQHHRVLLTVTAATTFFTEIGASPLEHIIPLVLGGVLAAPFGGWVVKRVPARGLMTAVGVLIVILSIVQLIRAFRSI